MTPANNLGIDMIIYCLMIEDTHTDTEARLFSTPEKALEAARSYLADFADCAAHVDPDDATMTDEQLKRAGWLFYACYSTEGDCVWVLPLEVDAS